jgi:hypothetical protein
MFGINQKEHSFLALSISKCLSQNGFIFMIKGYYKKVIRKLSPPSF